MLQANRESIIFPTTATGYVGNPSPVIVSNDYWRNAILMITIRSILTGKTVTFNVWGFDLASNQPMPSSASGATMGTALITTGALSASTGATLVYPFAAGVCWNGSALVNQVLPRKLFVAASHSDQSAIYDYTVALQLIH